MRVGLVAAFQHIDSTCSAIEALKKAQFKDFTVYTPTPRHEIEHAVDPPPSPIRRYTLIGGLMGLSFGYWIPLWTAEYWPLVVGGKAITTWIPHTIIGFELMVLVGALSTVFGMFISSRIPKITLTTGFDERFTGGDYGIFVQAPPERLKEAERMLRENGAVEIRDER